MSFVVNQAWLDGRVRSRGAASVSHDSDGAAQYLECAVGDFTGRASNETKLISSISCIYRVFYYD